MELLALLIWAGSILGCASLAKQKNRNVPGWAIGGVFFGIFALIVIAVLAPVPKTIEL